MAGTSEPLSLEKLLERIGDTNGSGPALIGFPFDENSSHLRGAAAAPPLIREALRSYAGNLCSETGIDLGIPGRLDDVGDLDTPGEEGAAIESSIAAMVARGLRPISLGGDHSIGFPIVRGFESAFEQLDMVQFDAHPDLYDSLQGNRLSHACPMARIMERGRVRRLVQVGIRASTTHQRQQAERFGVEVIEMFDGDPERPLVFDGPVYLSIDLDALDPAFAPGVAHREPGGLSTRQLVDAIRRLEGDLIGADIVEFNPGQDPAGITAPVGAKLIKEIAARMLAQES